MDIYNMLDPMGGDKYDSSGNLSNLLVGFLADPDILKGIAVNPYKRSSIRSRSAARSAATQFTPLSKSKARTTYGLSVPKVGMDDLRYIGSQETAEHYSKARKDYINNYKGKNNPSLGLKKSYRNIAGSLKFASRTFLASAALGVFADMFTPGISKAAASSNQMLANEMTLDSSEAYTQRQRALMAIHDSQLAVRNVLANEASFLHR